MLKIDAVNQPSSLRNKYKSPNNYLTTEIFFIDGPSFKTFWCMLDDG